MRKANGQVMKGYMYYAKKYGCYLVGFGEPLKNCEQENDMSKIIQQNNHSYDIKTDNKAIATIQGCPKIEKCMGIER